MQCVDPGDVRLHLAQSGDLQGAAVVYLNPLGADLRVWDSLLPLMPAGLRHIRFDLRGHGLSDAPDGPYRMGALIRDAERLLDALGVRGAVVVGAGLGGLVAQGLAVKRLDLVRALVLMGTAPRLGIAAQWQTRASMVQRQGMGALAGRIFDPSNPKVSGAVRIQRMEDGKIADFPAYQSLDIYPPELAVENGENFALNDLPAGQYRLTYVYGGKVYEYFVEIGPGILTLITIVLD